VGRRPRLAAQLAPGAARDAPAGPPAARPDPFGGARRGVGGGVAELGRGGQLERTGGVGRPVLSAPRGAADGGDGVVEIDAHRASVPGPAGA
jgi:hypothetical protein